MKPTPIDTAVALVPIFLLILFGVLIANRASAPSPAPSIPAVPPAQPSWPPASQALAGLQITSSTPERTFADSPAGSILYTPDALQIATDLVQGELPPSYAPILSNLSISPPDALLATQLIHRCATTGNPILYPIGPYYLIVEYHSTSRILIVTLRPRAVPSIAQL